MKKYLLLICILIVTIHSLRASTAYPGLIEFRQPDGTMVNIYLNGDEHVKWGKTQDGFTLLYNNDGYLEYAMLDYKGDLVPSGIIAQNINQRSNEAVIFLNSLSKGLTFSHSQIAVIEQLRNIYHEETTKSAKSAFPTTGNRKLICILIGYADLPFTKTQQDFDNLFNQIGYTANGATGSVKDYYLENSYGKFNLTVDVAGPYTASENMAYYGANDVNGYDQNPRALVLEAINLADPDVDFSEYDNNNNGKVDGVYIIYAGYGEEAGGGADAIWAHAWNLASPVVKDGVEIQRYSCSAELRGNSGSNITHIGVICHEFGHVLGAPDFYDTNYATGGQFEGTSKWDLMASGTWNNAGATPAHHNGFTKVVYYQWAQAIELNNPASPILYNATDSSNSFYIINTTTTNEYFLLENREQHKFDAYIPGSGMLIYHVHSGVFDVGNQINATHPQRMYPVAQNATSDPTSTPSSYGTINSSTCAWTGLSGTKTEFSDATLPSSKSWAGANTDKPITQIFRNETDKTVSFEFMGGAQGNPKSISVAANTFSSINIEWQLNDDEDEIMLAFSITGSFGIPEDGILYSIGDDLPGGGTVLYKGAATSYTHQELDDNTAYYYKIWSVLPANTYSSGLTALTRTLCMPQTAFPFLEDFESYTTCPDCWEVVDHQGNGQVWQFGVFNPAGAPHVAYLDSDGYGNGNTQNADLISPVFDFSGYEDVNISFQHYFRIYVTEYATLSYSINNGSSWTQIQQWIATTANPATFSQAIPALANQSQVKFKWNYQGSWGYYWIIDDIQVTATASNSLIVSNTIHEVNANVAYQNVTIEPDGNLTVAADKILTITDNLIIKSDASGHGSFIDDGVLIVQGDVFVEKFLAASNPVGWPVASPVADAPQSVFDGHINTFYFDALTSDWSILQPGNNMGIMKGYWTKFNADKTLEFSSDLNTKNIVYTELYRTGYQTGNYGWNLVGNPYPSYIDWSLVETLPENTSAGTFSETTKLRNAVYVLDENGNYKSFVNGIGTNGFDGIISPSTAFWVQVIPEITDPVEEIGRLTFNNQVRVHNYIALLKDLPTNVLKLKLCNGVHTDETIIRLAPEAGKQFEPSFDAVKMFSQNTLLPQIYTLLESNEKLAINTIHDDLNEVTSIPLAYKIQTGDILTITAENISSFSEYIALYLEDKQEDIIQDLRKNNNYTFTPNNQQDEDRFLLHLVLNQTELDNNLVNKQPIIYAAESALYINTLATKSYMAIYNIVGQEIFQLSLSGEGLHKINLEVATGAYVVSLIDDIGGMAKKKIFIE